MKVYFFLRALSMPTANKARSPFRSLSIPSDGGSSLVQCSLCVLWGSGEGRSEMAGCEAIRPKGENSTGCGAAHSIRQPSKRRPPWGSERIPDHLPRRGTSSLAVSKGICFTCGTCGSGRGSRGPEGRESSEAKLRLLINK